MTDCKGSTPGIQVTDLYKRFGGITIFDGIDLEVRDGEFLVIVGPSGCGKSTLLRIIAGIEPVRSGTILTGDHDITQAHPGERDLAMVFQDYALYPHMTVRQNLDFALRAAHLPREEITKRVQLTSQALGISELLTKKPAQLSGGQRQRVALGRAMIRQPRAYLMDEPLSNLDATLRVQMRAELVDFHRRTGGTVLYVTHDQVEAMTMGDRVAVMNAGRFEQIGTPNEVYEAPANLFVATFLGSPKMNVVDATVQTGSTEVELRSGDLHWSVPHAELPPSLPERVKVGFRPEAVTLDDETASNGSARFCRRVAFAEHLGNEVLAHLEPAPDENGLVSRLAPGVFRALHPLPRYRVSWSDIHLFDVTGLALWHGGQADPHRAANDIRAGLP